MGRGKSNLNGTMDKTIINHPPAKTMVIGIAHIKFIAVSIISWIAGSIAGLVMMFQDPVPNSEWWQHPAVVAAVVTALFVFAQKLLDHFRESRKDQDEREDERDEKHQTYSEKLQELTQSERAQLLGGLKDLHQKEIEFFKSQVFFKEVENFEARMRAHRYGNEVTRIHSHVYVCHSLMSQKGLEIPEFVLKSGEELMLGLEAEVLAFRQKLEEEKRQMIQMSNS